MASTAASFLRPGSFSNRPAAEQRRKIPAPRQISAAAQPQKQQQQLLEDTPASSPVQPPQPQESAPSAESLPVQPAARSKNMSREYGGQWLSSVTRHVRIYAAYIDPVTHAFDQTQMDKLTLILDPTNEFVWTKESCQMVYDYFQELVDLYEGADLTEYTLRLIGSDLEHYIRKLLYDGKINYNMNARVLNFSMGKPRVVFKDPQEPS